MGLLPAVHRYRSCERALRQALSGPLASAPEDLDVARREARAAQRRLRDAETALRGALLDRARWRLGGDVDRQGIEAEDVTQMALRKTLGSLAQSASDESAVGLLCKAQDTAIIDSARAVRRRPGAEPLDEAGMDLADAAPSAEEILIREVVRASALAALDAAHALIRESTRLQNPDDKRWVFEQLDLHGRAAADVLACAPMERAASDYAAGGASENLVDQHAARYLAQLERVCADSRLPPDHRETLAAFVCECRARRHGRRRGDVDSHEG